MVSIDINIKRQASQDSKFTAMFIQKASSFKAGIWVEKGERKANGKSLLGLLSLGIETGGTIIVTADGPDEENAITGIKDFANSLGVIE